MYVGGAFLSIHTHMILPCMQSSGGARDMVEIVGVVKQRSTQCHMPQNTTMEFQYYQPPPHVAHAILPSGVCGPLIANPSVWSDGSS